MMPTGVWLEIVSYRSFWDVPRFILAADPSSGFWILDGGFDPAQDEYSDRYRIFFAGTGREQARAAFEAQASGDIREVIGIVPVTSVEFDSTKRQELRIKPT